MFTVNCAVTEAFDVHARAACSRRARQRDKNKVRRERRTGGRSLAASGWLVLHFETGNLEQRPVITRAQSVIDGTVLNVHEGLFAGSQKDETGRFGRRVDDR